MTDSAQQQIINPLPDAPIQVRDITASDDPMVRVVALWWGYRIEMNHRAATAVSEILDQLENLLSKHFAETKIRRAICAVLKIKSFRIGNVATENGANVVSPWLLPFALAVVGEKIKDESLWYTVFDPNATTDTEKWSVDTEFNDTLSFSGPALAQYGKLLYCVHRGQGDDQHLWWTVYQSKDNTDDTDENKGGWGTDKKFRHHKSATPPALVAFENKLYCFHRGTNDGGADDCNLWMCQLNDEGTDWKDDTLVPGHTSTSGFAAVVFGNKIHLVYEGGDNSNSDHQIRHATWDGKDWSAPKTLQDHLTCDVPGLAVYNNQLHMVHKGWKDEFLWHAHSSDGITWTDDVQLLKHKSDQGPALATYNDVLYMVHRSCDNSDRKADLWWAAYTTAGGWTVDTKFNDHKTADNPALAVYADPQATVDTNLEEGQEPDPNVPSETLVPQLICVHRGA